MRMSPQPQLFVHDPGGRYLPLINRLGLECSVHATIQLDQLLSSVASNFGAIGVVSIDPNCDSSRLADSLSQIHRASRQSTTSILVAAGPPAIRTLHRELLIAGFALVASSTAEFERIPASATRYWKSLNWPQLTIEDAVARNLPWQPIGRHGFPHTQT